MSDLKHIFDDLAVLRMAAKHRGDEAVVKSALME